MNNPSKPYPIRRTSYGFRKMWSSDICQLLFGKDKLPAHGHARTEVQGVTIWVAPNDLNVAYRERKTRVWCECPICKKVVPLGRLEQHYKVHP